MWVYHVQMTVSDEVIVALLGQTDTKSLNGTVLLCKQWAMAAARTVIGPLVALYWIFMWYWSALCHCHVNVLNDICCIQCKAGILPSVIAAAGCSHDDTMLMLSVSGLGLSQSPGDTVRPSVCLSVSLLHIQVRLLVQWPMHSEVPCHVLLWNYYCTYFLKPSDAHCCQMGTAI